MLWSIIYDKNRDPFLLSSVIRCIISGDIEKNGGFDAITLTTYKTECIGFASLFYSKLTKNAESSSL